jgi:hypothetical protein
VPDAGGQASPSPCGAANSTSSYQVDADRAEKVAGIVGVSNGYNAYFVGQTQFLGA